MRILQLKKKNPQPRQSSRLIVHCQDSFLICSSFFVCDCCSAFYSTYCSFLLLLIKLWFEMCVSDLSSIPRSSGRHTEQKLHVSSSPGRLKLVRNVILFGAAPPSRVSVIYENANYDANANTTE